MKIIAYRSNDDIDIQFQDEFYYIKEHQTYSNFSTGSVKNPYDITVFGVGYVGAGKYKTKENNRFTIYYQQWKNMLLRCYVKEERHRAYEDARVCEEWLNFQNFAEWYYKNRYECEGRLHLDKDIKYPGNKLYSPYHCLLVPQRINMLFSNKLNKRGLPNGIDKNKKGYLAKYNGEELGKFSTLEEAYAVYSKAKKNAIIAIANEYKNQIPEEVYNALLNYEVRIENNKNYIVA